MVNKQFLLESEDELDEKSEDEVKKDSDEDLEDSEDSDEDSEDLEDPDDSEDSEDSDEDSEDLDDSDEDLEDSDEDLEDSEDLDDSDEDSEDLDDSDEDLEDSDEDLEDSEDPDDLEDPDEDLLDIDSILSDFQDDDFEKEVDEISAAGAYIGLDDDLEDESDFDSLMKGSGSTGEIRNFPNYDDLPAEDDLRSNSTNDKVGVKNRTVFFNTKVRESRSFLDILLEMDNPEGPSDTLKVSMSSLNLNNQDEVKEKLESLGLSVLSIEPDSEDPDILNVKYSSDIESSELENIKSELGLQDQDPEDNLDIQPSSQNPDSSEETDDLDAGEDLADDSTDDQDDGEDEPSDDPTDDLDDGEDDLIDDPDTDELDDEEEQVDAAPEETPPKSSDPSSNRIDNPQDKAPSGVIHIEVNGTDAVVDSLKKYGIAVVSYGSSDNNDYVRINSNDSEKMRSWMLSHGWMKDEVDRQLEDEGSSNLDFINDLMKDTLGPDADQFDSVEDLKGWVSDKEETESENGPIESFIQDIKDTVKVGKNSSEEEILDALDILDDLESSLDKDDPDRSKKISMIDLVRDKVLALQD